MIRLLKIILVGAIFLLPGCDPGDPAGKSEVSDATDMLTTGAEIYESKCGSCHDNPATKAPSKLALSGKNVASVRFSLTNGTMKSLAGDLSIEQIVTVSEYLAEDAEVYAPDSKDYCEERHIRFDEVFVRRWGIDDANTAKARAGSTTLTTENVGSMELAFAFELPEATTARSQPVITTDTLFVASTVGDVFALDRFTGCIKWHYHSDVGLRTALTLGEISGKPVIFFGDSVSSTSALDARTGELLWRVSVGVHEHSIQTGAIVQFKDFLYVPVSLYEVALAANPRHECCRAHGALQKLNASTGEILWTAHMTERAELTGKSKQGTNQWGPSGVPIWSTPTIDVSRNRVYVGTGQNASTPATALSDSVVAFDMDSGDVIWSFQATMGDTFNNGCVTDPVGANCPNWKGPDHDFGASIILTRDSSGKEVLLAGQKSGDVFSLDPDANGEVIWRTRVGGGSMLGGVHWGMAVSDNTLFAATNDPNFPGSVSEPGLYALDVDTGSVKWRYDLEPPCDTNYGAYFGRTEMYPTCSFYFAMSAAVSVANDLVFAPALDGVVRAFDVRTGDIRWRYNTVRSFRTVTGSTAHGGSMDNVGVQFATDMVYMQSGYENFGEMPGNVLLAFRHQ